jgi:hypothetical protein
MGAELIQDADAAARIAEGDEPLAQDFQAHGRAVRLGDLPGEEGGQPVAAQHLAHGGARPDAGHQLVVFSGQHASLQDDGQDNRLTTQLFGRRMLGQIVPGRCVHELRPALIVAAMVLVA